MLKNINKQSIFNLKLILIALGNNLFSMNNNFDNNVNNFTFYPNNEENNNTYALSINESLNFERNNIHNNLLLTEEFSSITQRNSDDYEQEEIKIFYNQDREIYIKKLEKYIKKLEKYIKKMNKKTIKMYKKIKNMHYRYKKTIDENTIFINCYQSHKTKIQNIKKECEEKIQTMQDKIDSLEGKLMIKKILGMYVFMFTMMGLLISLGSLPYQCIQSKF